MATEQVGTIAYVVCNDPQAHLELIELCNKWHRLSRNSMYIDGETSQLGYEASTGRRLKRPQTDAERSAALSRKRQRKAPKPKTGFFQR